MVYGIWEERSSKKGKADQGEQAKCGGWLCYVLENFPGRGDEESQNHLVETRVEDL